MLLGQASACERGHDTEGVRIVHAAMATVDEARGSDGSPGSGPGAAHGEGSEGAEPTPVESAI
jgi:hypothetical protein